MTFSEKAAQTALRLITAKGVAVEVRRLEKDYDPVTGAAAELVKVQGTLRVVVLPISSTPKGVFTEADNTLFEGLAGTKYRFMLAAAKGAPFEPVANDVLGPFEGTQYTVKGCTPLAPAGVPILYKIAALITPATPDNLETLELGSLEEAAALLETLVEQTLFSLQ